MNLRLELFLKRFVYIIIIYLGIQFIQIFDSIFWGFVFPGIIFMISILVFDYWFVLRERKVGGKRS